MPGSLSVRRKNAAKAPDAVERQVEKLFGLKPKVKRGNILPFAINPQTGKPELAAPQFLYDAARAFAAPGVAMSGQPINAEDEATNFALNFTGTGGVASRAARSAAGEGRAVLGMSGTPKASKSFAVKEQPVSQQPLALPAPGPGLPPQASKPRGGQWWVDKDIASGNSSPEEAARQGALGLALTQWVPEDVVLPRGDPAARLRQAFQNNMVPQTTETDAQKWLERALAKYYKNEFGSPDDPLRSLAERGLHYDPEMTPEKWKSTVDSYLLEDPIQQILFPPNPAGGMPGAGSNLRGEVMASMPWLAKAPTTDKVYGISGGGLDLGHFNDEFLNALNPEASGLPFDLAVRPESLGRMTFPQAVEHVGKINQFRAKEMERAARSNLDSPAIQTFKEYADDNPMGLRWVELRAPETKPLPEWGWEDLGEGRYRDQNGAIFTADPDRAGGFKADDDYWHLPEEQNPRKALEAALKYEGDTMGHCVGGYCPEVMSGRSRIFSLRDAKGEPHVTIETQPARFMPNRDQREAIYEQARLEIEALDIGDPYTEAARIIKRQRELVDEFFNAQKTNPPPDEIIQIKGKQNLAPKDDYLPFVQDFVKSGQWSNIGDLKNTGLVRLPDGRYITAQQAEEAVAAIPETTTMQRAWGGREMVPTRRVYNPAALDQIDLQEWETIAPYFQGFAIGGRVDADRCFCHNPLTVKKGKR
jgi:hypothetical protein